MARKLICTMLVSLLLVTSTVPAMAAGLLPDPGLFEDTPAVSFGVTVGRFPDLTTALEDGRIEEHYSDVTTAEYEAFSERLLAEGYELLEIDLMPHGFDAVVARGLMMLEIRYMSDPGTISVIYPTGADVEQPVYDELFPNCIRVDFGEEISVPKVGRFVFRWAALSDGFAPDATMGFDYTNTTSEAQPAQYYEREGDTYAGSSALAARINLRIAYVTADGREEQPVSSCWADDKTEAIGPGQRGDMCVLFRDGILDHIPDGEEDVIAFLFTLGEQSYALYYLENGEVQRARMQVN